MTPESALVQLLLNAPDYVGLAIAVMVMYILYNRLFSLFTATLDHLSEVSKTMREISGELRNLQAVIIRATPDSQTEK